jgi:hypothetical protein
MTTSVLPAGIAAVAVRVLAPRFVRVAAACGIAAAALYLLAFALFFALVFPELPALGAPAAERAAFYAEMSRDSLYKGISYLAQLQMPLLLVFFGGLSGVLRRAEGGDGGLSTTVAGAGVALVLVVSVAIAFEDHLMLGMAAAGADPRVVASIDGLAPKAFALGGFAQAIIVFGVAALLVPVRALPRWLAWAGAVVGVVALLGTLTLMRGMFYPAAALGMLLFRVWLLGLGVAMLRAAGR